MIVFLSLDSLEKRVMVWLVSESKSARFKEVLRVSLGSFAILMMRLESMSNWANEPRKAAFNEAEVSHSEVHVVRFNTLYRSDIPSSSKWREPNSAASKP